MLWVVSKQIDSGFKSFSKKFFSCVESLCSTSNVWYNKFYKVTQHYIINIKYYSLEQFQIFITQYTYLIAVNSKIFQ